MSSARLIGLLSQIDYHQTAGRSLRKRADHDAHVDARGKLRTAFGLKATHLYTFYCSILLTSIALQRIWPYTASPKHQALAKKAAQVSTLLIAIRQVECPSSLRRVPMARDQEYRANRRLADSNHYGRTIHGVITAWFTARFLMVLDWIYEG
jgi:hypothetical protein